MKKQIIKNFKISIVFILMISIFFNCYFFLKANKTNIIMSSKDELISFLEEDIDIYTEDIAHLMDVLSSSLISSDEYNDCRYQVPNVVGEKKIAYLTFDDGPSVYTKYFLDVLKACNVKATFFVVGENAKKREDIIKRMDEEGHVIANHGYSHRFREIYKSLESFKRELEETHKIVFDITGNHPNLFRFPGGSTMPPRQKFYSFVEALYQRGYYFFDWNVSTGDGYPQSKKKVIKNLKRGLQNKDRAVILMHDSKKNSLLALPEVIKILREEGYIITTLNEYSFKSQHRAIY